MTIAVEAKHPRDLPKLVEVMRRLNIEDPNLVVTINQESGETLMAGMGVLHLEIATTQIQQPGLEIITSPPIINYRETIRARAGPIMSRSPNRHNKIFIEVEPLEPDVDRAHPQRDDKREHREEDCHQDPARPRLGPRPGEELPGA